MLHFAELGEEWDGNGYDMDDLKTVASAIQEEDIEPYDLDEVLKAKSSKLLEECKGALSDICEVLGKVNYED